MFVLLQTLAVTTRKPFCCNNNVSQYILPSIIAIHDCSGGSSKFLKQGKITAWLFNILVNYDLDGFEARNADFTETEKKYEHI